MSSQSLDSRAGGHIGHCRLSGGGDFLVTLGLWDNTNFVGSDFGVASTTMHEFGHTFGLGHGGDALPNCKPNYLSVMNYMFQLGGLVDAAGVPHLGYSSVDYRRSRRNRPERNVQRAGTSGPAGTRRGPRVTRERR